jgi:hypothetical protein
MDSNFNIDKLINLRMLNFKDNEKYAHICAFIDKRCLKCN